MLQENEWVPKVLSDLLAVAPTDYSYVVLGSVALMSYTVDHGYERPIKDIDVIGSEEGVKQIAKGLKEKGYTQESFVDKTFPFYDRLSKHSATKYLRFVKDDKALEIMTTDMPVTNGNIRAELYPGLSFSLPQWAIQETVLGDVHFKAVSPETLYSIYRVGLRTWGFFVRKKMEQRKNDLASLQSIVDKKKLSDLVNNTVVHVGRLNFGIPKILVD